MKSIRDKDLIIKFGHHLRELREEKNITQENLGLSAEISANQVGRIERGEINPTLSTLSAIAKALDVSLSNLLKEV